MKCPFCGNEFKPVGDAERVSVFAWVRAYNRSTNILSACCDRVVRVSPVTSFTLAKAYNQQEDDWCNEPKPKQSAA